MTATDNCPLDMAPSQVDSSQLEMIRISGMDMSFMLSWPLFED